MADNMYGAANWLPQKDNGRPHTAAKTQQKLAQMKISMLSNLPPYSLDLSPKKLMKRRVDKYKLKTIQQLIQCVHYVWDISHVPQ
ncbi:hypothetical protein M9Y10_036988 [Tritrichomonas musculus]|uniref:DDE Tnp4 domain-containing protein n=1 Tax=Tritrichomonas musculus TaxID=1915356 RepID=A0ABR2GSM9_9EUKA